MKTKILMVCLGNICRSPLAEGILKSKLDPEKYQVDSCGTSSYHIGSKPDTRSIKVAKEHHIDITDQRAAQFSTGHFDQYHTIYAMDRSNYQNIIKLARNTEDQSKVKLILDELQLNETLDVPDPYYGGERGFEEVFEMLDQACNTIASKLESTT
ncbi:low molecular weight protein-tyrosine-phosphatase [Aquimarina spongiae]|uniref:protein-tyrosine-phosphatase n=1 Tax=Aquimarina spongiae TaxID=570521 RepID=A0A1M6G2D7_9FLAO|nr:low molecular weight protein-tyrosine-phosphatase [Aquimarina spongiae]SHJ04022.1 protein tyrosine phosphatase [Aquimarina spongiae]